MPRVSSHPSTRLAPLLVLGFVAAACGFGPGPTASATATAAPMPTATQPAATETAGPTATEAPTESPTEAPTAPPPTPSPTATHPVVLPSPRPPNPTPKPTATECAVRTLGSMSEAERIGQLFLVSLAGNAMTGAEATGIRAYHFGSVWLSGNRTVGVTATRTLANSVQALATAATTARVRFFVAADQEGGLVQRLAGSGFSTIPSALDQGLIAPATLQADALAWGRQLAAAGVNLNFAPVMDVVPPGADASNQPIGVLRREYGHDPAIVASHGVAVVRGMASAGVATSLKHFPGLGRVTGNTDYATNVVDSVTTANDPYLASFRAGIAAGTPFVMISLATYTRIDPARRAVFSPAIVTTLLRNRLGFKGVILSDSLGATAVKAVPVATRGVAYLEAGGDMIVAGGISTPEAIADGIAARAASDPAFRAIVDAAALRVLRMKGAYGLLPC